MRFCIGYLIQSIQYRVLNLNRDLPWFYCRLAKPCTWNNNSLKFWRVLADYIIIMCSFIVCWKLKKCCMHINPCIPLRQKPSHALKWCVVATYVCKKNIGEGAMVSKFQRGGDPRWSAWHGLRKGNDDSAAWHIALPMGNTLPHLWQLISSVEVIIGRLYLPILV